MTDIEEKSNIHYYFWQDEQDVNFDDYAIKAVFCHIHAEDREKGEMC